MLLCLVEWIFILTVFGTGVRGALGSEDWKIREWDVIVVGAGPAGIIGMSTLISFVTGFD